MRVGWRQTIRNGKNKDELIEDVGILSDFVVRPEARDFTLNRTTLRQLDRIATHFRQTKKDGKMHTYCKLFFF